MSKTANARSFFSSLAQTSIKQSILPQFILSARQTFQEFPSLPTCDLWWALFIRPTFQRRTGERKKIQQSKEAVVPSHWRLKKHARMIHFHRGISRLKRILLCNFNNGETDLKSRDVEKDPDSPPTQPSRYGKLRRHQNFFRKPKNSSPKSLAAPAPTCLFLSYFLKKKQWIKPQKKTKA